ncbi:hypothetical protein [Mesorhizobium sp.]|uniref:hypothetical protein n=1 Tax=Mesorhizobium sp. TaxID=1871066 RepID=UPI0025811E0A|nr:hypothetical protein [Mesorhizobium sp.]
MPYMQALWFRRRAREHKVCVEGQLIFKTTAQTLHAALAEQGITYVQEEMAKPDLVHMI